MRSSHSLDRLDTAFDDDRLVADAGLLLPATLAAHLDLRGLVERHLHLGSVAGRAHVGDKLLTLIFSALAGGACINDANALRAGGTERVLPSGRFAANGAWLSVQVMAHNLARWTARIGLGEGIVTTKTLRRRLFSLNEGLLMMPPSCATPHRC